MSLRIDRSVIATGPDGAVAHRDLIDHSARFQRRLYPAGEGVWCHVGGGLSNITFVDAPEGLLVIDSGECREEADEALAAVREVSDRALAAMICSQYHYVGGTATYLDDSGSTAEDFPIWAHVDGARLLAEMGAEMGAEVGPSRTTGLVGQFGLALPADGPDSMPNVGLGPWFKHPRRSTSTLGYVAPNHTVDAPTDTTIAGERVVLTPVPSDSDDTLVIWLPDRGVCINNHLLPALFNVYPLRGEAYRDPTVLLRAFDVILAHSPTVLVGVHGPPIEGADAVRRALIDSRDAIQFDPDRADFDLGVQWRFSDPIASASLRIRHGVAIPGEVDGDADVTIGLDLPTWAQIYAGNMSAAEAMAAGTLTIDGEPADLVTFFAAFDQPHLSAAFES